MWCGRACWRWRRSARRSSPSHCDAFARPSARWPDYIPLLKMINPFMRDDMPANATQNDTSSLPLVRLGIDTHQQATAYVRRESAICRSEGFNALSRVQLKLNGRSVICTLNILGSPRLEGEPEVIGVSESAWLQLGARDGDRVTVAHPPPLDSLACVRAKIYGRALERSDLYAVMRDIAAGRYSDI